LTPKECHDLEQLILAVSAPARTQTRARIQLLSDRSQGQKRADDEVAEAMMCCQRTVVTVRRRFLSSGLAPAVHDRPPPGLWPQSDGTLRPGWRCWPAVRRPKAQRGGPCGCSSTAGQRWGPPSTSAMSPAVQCSKKRTQALVREVVFRLQAIGAARRQDGRRTGCLRPTRRCERVLGLCDETSKGLHDTPRGTLAMKPRQPQGED